MSWISVTERLPDDDITVLLVIEGSDELWFGYHDAGQWRYQNGHQISYAAITHWMHLPELPHA
jgi:hypothetical protein